MWVVRLGWQSDGSILQRVEILQAAEGSAPSLICLMPVQVEQENAAILAEGGRKLEVLRAIKDFKKGIYGLQWEHKRSKLEVRPLRPAGEVRVVTCLTVGVQTLQVRSRLQGVIGWWFPSSGRRCASSHSVQCWPFCVAQQLCSSNHVRQVI